MRAWVYILASRRNGTLYVGVTTRLHTRIQQHHAAVVFGFSAKYRVSRLVHVETLPQLKPALERERRLKQWKRAWKIALIERDNPYWRDLRAELYPVTDA